MQYLLIEYVKSISTTTRGSEFRYPTTFDAQELEGERRGPILYDFIKPLDASNRGQCLVLVSDRLAAKYDRDSAMRIITDAEADAWIAANQTVQSMPEYRVDQDTVQALQLMIASGRTLSSAELDMIDPDHPRTGIRRARRDRDSLLGIKGPG